VTNFALSDELEGLAAAARALGHEWAARRTIREDSWIVGFDREFSLELGRRGWLGMTWPVEEGGHGRPPIERLVVTEALISTGAPIAASWFGDRQIGPSLLTFGTAEQRRRYLPPLVEGSATWCLGMSEPDAGSDVAAIATSAVRDGGEYVIDGAKVWTSFAEVAEHCYLIARTDPDAPPHAGLSELIVPMGSPGITVSPIKDMSGARHFCEVRFERVRVPAEHLVGELNGSFRQLMRQLEHERGGIDRLVSNRALYEDARDAADRDDPLVRQELAAIESAYRLGRLLVIREVVGQAPRSFSAATKLFCTVLEQRVARLCGTVFGADALCTERLARALCYAPAYTIQGGTNEILRNVIGERILGLPRQ